MNKSTSLDNNALEAAMYVFRHHGLTDAPDQALAKAMELSPAEMLAHYPERAALVQAAVLADLARQRRDHDQIYVTYTSAVERLYSLLQYALHDLTETSPRFFGDIMHAYPHAWEAMLEHLESYSAPQLQQLLNDGIRQRLFRSDINIRLVTKVLMAQIHLVLNPQAFPPEQFNTAEVFRSVFLYYVRGICTEEGARIAANHFSKI